MRITEQNSSFPKQNKDYVYYWKLIPDSYGNNVYSYHLKNISDKTIKFYSFSLKDKGGEYSILDNLLQTPVFNGGQRKVSN